MRLLLILMLAVVSGTAIAHPGHGLDDIGHGSAFVEGLLHPLTGLDHLAMALSLGVLLARTFNQARFYGLGLLLLSLAGGFWLGFNSKLSVNIAEYGIVASLLVLAVSLWQRSASVFLSTIALLGAFHGIAHGVEVGDGVNPFAFMLGMIITMSALYGLGVVAGRLMKNHLRFGDRITAVFAGVVALLGLA